MLAVYGYHAYNHYVKQESFYIHRPDEKLSAAENILRMLRPDMKYTELEAKVLDIALVLHMEHGGGNNSAFTTHVVTSAGSDTYSVIAAALSSLKGPKHGGANIKVVQMMQDRSPLILPDSCFMLSLIFFDTYLQYNQFIDKCQWLTKIKY